MALRYLLVIPRTAQGSAASVISTNLKLHEHYYGYLGVLKAQNAKKCQERIAKQIEKIKKEEMEREKMEKVFNETKTAKEEEDKVAASFEKLMIGKGSASANKRILIEYKGLTTSKDFKNFQITFREDNVYIWKIVFDIPKFDVTKELKGDFEALEKGHGVVYRVFTSFLET